MICFQFLLSIIAFSVLFAYMLSISRLVESLNFAFVLVESAQAYIVLFLLPVCYIALYSYSKSVFCICYSTVMIVFRLTSFI